MAKDYKKENEKLKKEIKELNEELIAEIKISNHHFQEVQEVNKTLDLILPKVHRAHMTGLLAELYDLRVEKNKWKKRQ